MYNIDLKLFRKHNGMNQADAAAYFECNQSFISLIETGRSTVPESFISKLLVDNNVKKDALIENDIYTNNESTLAAVLEIVKKQTESLAKKDEQIDRLITLLENQLNK